MIDRQDTSSYSFRRGLGIAIAALVITLLVVTIGWLLLRGRSGNEIARSPTTTTPVVESSLPDEVLRTEESLAPIRKQLNSRAIGFEMALRSYDWVNPYAHETTLAPYMLPDSLASLVEGERARDVVRQRLIASKSVKRVDNVEITQGEVSAEGMDLAYTVAVVTITAMQDAESPETYSLTSNVEWVKVDGQWYVSSVSPY